MGVKKLFAITAATFLLILASCGTQGSEKVSQRPHFIVNGTIYWSSSYPSGTMPDTFQYAGEIKETIWETPTSDWQSYGLPVGSKVYLDPAIPYQAWIDGAYRYVTEEAAKRYLLHKGELYVFLGSVPVYDGEYYSDYRDAWNLIIKSEDLPSETIYLGTSVFEGYDLYPTLELGSNAFTTSRDIYQHTEDTNVLFALLDESSAVYVKVP